MILGKKLVAPCAEVDNGGIPDCISTHRRNRAAEESPPKRDDFGEDPWRELGALYAFVTVSEGVRERDTHTEYRPKSCVLDAAGGNP
jgi:hypothetical protein